VKARRTALIAAAALAAGVIVGCGGDDGGDVDVGPAAAAPESAPIYVDATVRPQGTAQTDANAGLGKILDTDDPGGKIVSLINEQGQQEPAGQQFTYEQDIAPWLGTTSASSSSTSRMTPTGPRSSRRRTPMPLSHSPAKPRGDGGQSQPETYNGVSYQADPDGTDPDGTDEVFGVVDDFLIQGSLEGFKAAVDASKETPRRLGRLHGRDRGPPRGPAQDLLLGPEERDCGDPPEELQPGGQDVIEQIAGENLDAPVSGSLTGSENSFDLEFTGGNEVETPVSALLGEVRAMHGSRSGSAIWQQPEAGDRPAQGVGDIRASRRASPRPRARRGHPPTSSPERSATRSSTSRAPPSPPSPGRWSFRSTTPT
jgi:hypothetical protein